MMSSIQQRRHDVMIYRRQWMTIDDSGAKSLSGLLLGRKMNLDPEEGLARPGLQTG